MTQLSTAKHSQDDAGKRCSVRCSASNPSSVSRRCLVVAGRDLNHKQGRSVDFTGVCFSPFETLAFQKQYNFLMFKNKDKH